MLPKDKYVFKIKQQFKIVLLALLFMPFSSISVFSQYASIQNDSLLILGNEVYRQGDYKRSEKIYREALTNYPPGSLNKEKVVGTVGLGASILDQGRVKEGAAWIFKADSLASISTVISLEVKAYAKSNAGWATWWVDDGVTALPVYVEAYDLAQESEDKYRIAQISNSLSILTRDLGKLNEAIKFAKVADSYFQEIGDLFLLSISKSNLYSAYEELGMILQAENTLLESLKIKELYGNLDLLASDYKRLGLFYKKKGEYAKALTFIKEYLDLTTNLTNPYDRIEAFKDMASIYYLLGEFDASLEYINQSNRLDEEFDLGEDPASLILAGLTYQKLEQFGLARELLNKALYRFIDLKEQRSVIETYLQLSQLNLEEGSLNRAKEIAKSALLSALETESKQLKAKSYAALSAVDSQLGNNSSALSLSKKAYQIASSFNGYRLANYTIDLAKTFHKTGNDSAFIYADRAFTEIEREQNNIYGDNLESNVFRDYASFYDEVAFWYLDKKNDINTAFEITERGRSRVLLERLSSTDSIIENVLNEPELITLRQKEKTIDKLYREIEATSDENKIHHLEKGLIGLELEYQAYTNSIHLKNPRLNKTAELPLTSISQLQNKMSAKDALIEYMITDKHLISFWITKSSSSFDITTFDSDTSPKLYLSNKISLFRKAIQEQEVIGVLDSLSKPLYDRLLRSFIEKNSSIENLIIVPTHSISVLPFDALSREGTFLVESLNIKYLPSSSIYSFIKNPYRKTTKDILAVAGSGFNVSSTNSTLQPQGNFASLPSSLLEIDAITTEFNNYTALKNEEVTESVIKSLPLNEYRFIHFATHGNVNEKNPQQSGLILSKMNEFESSFGEDGYLNSLEISKLKLNSDMVVLSACNTAIGRLVSGEGLLGLQRSFFQAGASSVIVSLWSVYDKSTSALMSEFYQRLKKYEDEENGLWNKMKIYFDFYEPPLFGFKERALHDAKLSMIDHPYYNHPVNWAPFIIIGK